MPAGDLISVCVSITSISEAGSSSSTEVTATCQELSQLLQQGAAQGQALGAQQQQRLEDMASALMDFADRVAAAGEA
jgi:hypothetical protein